MPTAGVRESLSHFLVAEDDGSAANLLETLLSRVGYDVTVAADGAEAVGQPRQRARRLGKQGDRVGDAGGGVWKAGGPAQLALDLLQQLLLFLLFLLLSCYLWVYYWLLHLCLCIC